MRGLSPRALNYLPALNPLKQTPHPSAMLRIASTLSHKGRGRKFLTTIYAAPPLQIPQRII